MGEIQELDLDSKLLKLTKDDLDLELAYTLGPSWLNILATYKLENTTFGFGFTLNEVYDKEGKRFLAFTDTSGKSVYPKIENATVLALIASLIRDYIIVYSGFEIDSNYLLDENIALAVQSFIDPYINLINTSSSVDNSVLPIASNATT